jgi:hypothetical protein
MSIKRNCILACLGVKLIMVDEVITSSKAIGCPGGQGNNGQKESRHNKRGEGQMEYSKEELVKRIETARLCLDTSIDEKHAYEEIYKNSVELDGLIAQYMDAGY